MSRGTRALIDLAALRHNFGRVRALAPHSRIMAIVKADGYGHGLERVAQALPEADAFGVATLSDAERLRAIGIRQRIVHLEGFLEPEDLDRMRALEVDSIVHHAFQLELLAQRPDPRPLRCWVKLDTGMHRLGFAPDRLAEVLDRLRACPGVDPELNLMTHFACADEAEDALSGVQQARLEQAARGLRLPRSLANSAATLRRPGAHADWVRVGGLLYGISPIDGETGLERGLKPVMTLQARIIAINTVAAGESIGYGGGYRCPETMPVGVVSIGYGDGYPRHAGNGTPVLLHGRRAALVGRVSMDMLCIDLRAHPDARIGDIVTLWGQGLPAEDIARHSGTIAYELLCGMTRRVQFDTLPS